MHCGAGVRKPWRAEVRWLDPVGKASWHTLKEARAVTPCQVTTHGWVLRDDEELFILAGSRSLDGNYGDINSLPAGCVVKVEEK